MNDKPQTELEVNVLLIRKSQIDLLNQFSDFEKRFGVRG